MTPTHELSALDELDRPTLVQFIARIGEALHSAGLTPSHELGVALIYLGSCIAREHPRRTTP